MEYHVPVLFEESISALDIQPGGTYVDVTFGAGGHSQSILNRLNAKGHLYSFDQDDDAVGNVISNPSFTFIKSNFKYLKRYMEYYSIDKVDGILADLGVSSHQIDEISRGFSYRSSQTDLDMRMNQQTGLTAKSILAEYSKAELVRVFSAYGEVKNSKKLASIIVDARERGRIHTTNELLNIIEEVIVGKRQKYLSQVFQALRIEVNGEIAVLIDFLQQAKDLLAPGGRLVVISYHSLEDRLVKRFFKTGNIRGELIKDEYGNIINDLSTKGLKLTVPSEEEQVKNVRSRSAKMRIAEKK